MKRFTYLLSTALLMLMIVFMSFSSSFADSNVESQLPSFYDIGASPDLSVDTSGVLDVNSTMAYYTTNTYNSLLDSQTPSDMSVVTVSQANTKAYSAFEVGWRSSHTLN